MSELHPPEWLKAGALCVTRDGRKARVYAVGINDGPWLGVTVHGSVFSFANASWMLMRWKMSGASISNHPPDVYDLVGPWVEPVKEPRLYAWRSQKDGGVILSTDDGGPPQDLPVGSWERVPWLDEPLSPSKKESS